MVNSTVADFVVSYRRKHGLSQSQLAKKIGLSAKYVSNIECKSRIAQNFCLVLMAILNKKEQAELLDLMKMDASDRFSRKMI